MNQLRPGILSVRSVNEYRRRDTVSYLALRYCLDNEAARTDVWAREVATELVMTRTRSPYFRALHFKESRSDGQAQHREMFLPSGSEALAEAALLEECERHPLAFRNPPVVHSYSLNSEGNRQGVFRHYMYGLSERHDAIARACEDCKDGIVQYVDIKRFYPSITPKLASQAWSQHCEISSLPVRLRTLGEKLIADQAGVQNKESNGILTGPMFSHLLANLVLREIDNKSLATLPVQYFRYVDDITLVGDSNAVANSVNILRSQLAGLGLTLHDESSPKHVLASCTEWLAGRNDFRREYERISWPSFIYDLTRFLILNPHQRDAVQSAFRSESLRIPVRDYSVIARERHYVERVLQHIGVYWNSGHVRLLTIGGLVRHAKLLRKRYEAQFDGLLETSMKLSGYARKRRIPKLRYFAGRLVYLAEDDSLLRHAPLTFQVPELHLYAQVMKAVASGEISEVMPLGSNAAQAAAQPMLAAGKNSVATTEIDTQAKQQGLATFLLNGMQVKHPTGTVSTSSEILRFAASGSDAGLMRSADPFVREIACLHGLSSGPRHAETLRAVYDEDEELSLDAIEQIQQSASE
jgi:hypothetical protein